MKVCPVCGTVFQGSETFCPHDGARLFTTSTEVGAWKDKTLDDVVKLDHLLFVDELGERYLGTLIGQDVRVKVTLFNMVAQPGAAKFKDLSMTQAIMEEPLPKQLAQVITVNEAHDPPYLIEHAPAGPTLRQLLNEREHLDWPTAIRITNNLSRIIEWLSQLGIVHRALHPHAIHITDIQAGTVALSEWAHGVLHYQANALEAARQDEVVIYSSYVAPEQTDDASRADSRSMIYSAGMLLYEMLAGVPPFFGQEAEDILKRHRRERPTKLSISSQDKTLGTSLDELFELISNRLPEERFQTPLAMINALSTVLESDETFPELTRDGTTITLDTNHEVDDASSSTLLFVDAEELQKTKDARQAEADAITQAAQKEQEAQKAEAQPAPQRRKKKKRRRKRPAEADVTSTEVKGEASTEIKGETSTSDKPSTPEVDDATAPTEQMDTSVLEEDKRDPSVVKVDDPEEAKSKSSEEGSSKIIVSEELSEPQEPSSAISGSSQTAEEDVDDASGETIVVTPDTSRPRKKKRRRVRPRPAQNETKSEATTDKAETKDTKETDKTKDTDTKTEEAAEQPDAKDKASKEADTPETSKPEDKSDDTSATSSEKEPTTTRKKKRRRKRPASKETPAAKTPEKDQPAAKDDDDSNAQDSAATKTPEAKTPEEDKPKEAPKSTTPKAPATTSSDSKEDIETWFATSTDEAWDQSYLEEHSQRTEKKYKSILVGALILFFVILIATMIYVQFIAEVKKDEEASLRSMPTTHAVAQRHLDKGWRG